MVRLVALLVANGLTLYILARIIPDHVAYDGTETLVIFAIVLALLNTVLRPILQVIALPLTCLTLGLFAVVVNAAVFYLAAELIEGIRLTFLGALAGTVVASVISGLLSSVLDGD